MPRHLQVFTHGLVPQYLSELCRLVATVPGRQHLCSARCGQLDVSRFRRTTYVGRSISFVPMHKRNGTSYVQYV